MTALTGRRLEWLLRTRGTDLAAWPAGDRAAALDFLRRSPEAQEIYADALAREEEAPEPDIAVFGRMQAALRRRLAPVPLAWRGVGVGVLAACVVAGLYLSVETVDLDIGADAGTDPFGAAQMVSVASLDQ